MYPISFAYTRACVVVRDPWISAGYLEFTRAKKSEPFRYSRSRPSALYFGSLNPLMIEQSANAVQAASSL
nr:MAG TPA: hypothetical protein [Caudoviricetes sp.]